MNNSDYNVSKRAQRCSCRSLYLYSLPLLSNSKSRSIFCRTSTTGNRNILTPRTVCTVDRRSGNTRPFTNLLLSAKQQIATYEVRCSSGAYIARRHASRFRRQYRLALHANGLHRTYHVIETVQSKMLLLSSLHYNEMLSGPLQMKPQNLPKSLHHSYDLLVLQRWRIYSMRSNRQLPRCPVQRPKVFDHS